MKYWGRIETVMLEGIGEMFKVKLYSNLEEDGNFLEGVYGCRTYERAERILELWATEPNICLTLMFGKFVG